MKIPVSRIPPNPNNQRHDILQAVVRLIADSMAAIGLLNS